eukprot:scaffold44412_cov26-Tisochrysis_lutea.AAC.1
MTCDAFPEYLVHYKVRGGYQPGRSSMASHVLVNMHGSKLSAGTFDLEDSFSLAQVSRGAKAVVATQ